MPETVVAPQEERRLNILFRLYGLPGCKHCEWAYRKLMTAELPPNSVHVVSWEGDPVISEGLVKLQGKPPEVGPDFPALVSFMTGEIIVGEKEGDYDRLIELVRTSVRTISSDTPAPEVGAAQATEGETFQEPASGSVPASVPRVSGSVDSGAATPVA